MSPSGTRSGVTAELIAAVAAELVARRPDLEAAITVVPDVLGVRHPAGGAVVVGRARFGCVLGWAVSGPEPMGLWPGPDDPAAIADEVLARLDS